MALSVKEASAFLNPVLDKEQLVYVKEKSLILRLSKSLTTTTDKSIARVAVINHALDLVSRIHEEICAHDPAEHGARLEAPNERRVITALLDLIVLEGIYPGLSPGVGIPIERRARSFMLPSQLLKQQGRIEEVDEVSENLLVSILEKLSSLLETPKVVSSSSAESVWNRRFRGVEGIVREQCLVDVIAGVGELAFNPDSKSPQWEERFNELTDGISTGALMPILLSLLHPASPPWFRQPIAKCLSVLPISRPKGVQSILELFLAAASSGNVTVAASPQLSTDALAKASRLILSVPTSIAPREYFSKISPQLLEALRSEDQALQGASAFVIAELLGKRGNGIEELIEDELVLKIVSKFNPAPRSRFSSSVAVPSSSTNTSSALLDLETKQSRQLRPTFVFELPDEPVSPGEILPLVSDPELSTAVRSLEALLSSHPSPLIPERFISPVLIPLWGLLGYAKSTSRSLWHDRVFGILKAYFAVALDKKALEQIQNDLVFTGGDRWTFGPGSSGGIEIREDTFKRRGGVDMEMIDSQVEELFTLVDTKSTVVNEFFLDIFRTWLSRADESDPLKMLVTVRILQEMLGAHGEALAKKPTEILQIIKGVLDEYTSYLDGNNTPSTVQGPKASLLSLGKIVPENPGSMGDEDDTEQRTETVSMALTLLSTLLSNPDTKFTPSDSRILTALHPTLERLTASMPDPNLRTVAANLYGMLRVHTPQSTSAPTSLSETQRETYATALSYLRDPLVPVRAHGLHLLRTLITERAPIVEITSTTRQLIDLVKDGDSFVYLNVVKCLSALATRHPKTVTGMLVGAYVDDDGNLGLDERLKIGEALGDTVQRLGEALVGETAELVGEGMIGIVSRRRIRKQEQEEKGKKRPPKNSDDEEDEEELGEEGNPLIDTQKQDIAIQSQIVGGWSQGRGSEDIRIRTSALSILGTALEANAIGLGERIIREALDVCLPILMLETNLESGILRRAAVVCIAGVLSALVGQNAGGMGWRKMVWGLVKERIVDFRRVLGYIGVTDEDGLVREHAGVVADNLEAVIQRGMIGGRAVVESTPTFQL